MDPGAGTVIIYEALNVYEIGNEGHFSTGPFPPGMDDINIRAEVASISLHHPPILGKK